MNALISGQVGVAVLISNNNSMAYIKIDEPGVEYPCSIQIIPRLLDGATDVIEIKDSTREDASKKLDLLWKYDRALHLILIFLDNKTESSTREMAVNCLERLLSDQEIYDYVINRFYSHPLPLIKQDDVRVKEESWPNIYRLLKEIDFCQNQIKKCREAWDNLPINIFGDINFKNQCQENAINSGLFKLLVKTTSDPLASRSLIGNDETIPPDIFKIWMQCIGDFNDCATDEVAVSTYDESNKPYYLRKSATILPI